MVFMIALIVLGSLLFIQVHAQHATTFKFSETAPEQVLRVMENNANALFAEINSKYDLDNSQLDLSSSVVSEFAQNRIANMWAVSHFYCTRTSMNTRVMKMVSSDVYQVRNIPVCFKEAESDEYRYQHVVLEFDRSGKISDLYCTLYAPLPITDNSMVMTSQRNIEMINTFLNNYFTAYICKDLNFIERVFSEDILITEGKVLLYRKKDDNGSKIQSNSQRIEYIIQNKQHYLEKLRRVFSRNSFVNVKFEGVEIIQSEANPNVYGVRLNQYWHVSGNDNVPGYNDEGKLFLIIYFDNETQPEILVRIWQPFKDVNGNVIQYSEEDFYSIGDFQIE